MKLAYLKLALIAVLFISACGGGGGDSSGSTAGTSSAATITSFNPTSGAPGSTITIAGTNFSTTSANNTVRFNGIAATVTAATTTSLTVMVPSSASTGTVSVQAAGETATSADSFIVSAGVPAITSIYPTSGAPGRTVTITGVNFSSTPANNTVWFNGFAATVTAATVTSLEVTVPSSAEDGSISVKTEGGLATSTASFTVYPTITSFSPTSGKPGDTVTITGNNFKGNDEIYFWNGIRAYGQVLQGKKSLTVKVPNITSSGQIIIAPYGGNNANWSAANFVLDNAAMITSFAPTYGAAGTSVTIYGSNFAATPAGNVVKFGGVLAATSTFACLSGCVPAFMKVIVPAGANGSGKITVTTIGGTGVSADNFSVSEIVPLAKTLSVSPTPLSIGSQTVGGYYWGRVNLTNTGAVSLQISQAAVSGGNFVDRGTSCYGYNYMLEYYNTLAPGASCYVDIGFSPTVVGTSTGTLSITSTATGSPHTVSLSGTGVSPLAPVVSFSPASLTFAARELGTSSAAQAITLTNTGTAALDIAGIEVSGEYVQANACPPSLAVGARCTISVTFTPVRLVGIKDGSLAFLSNAAGSPHRVSLKGVGSLSKSGQLAIFTRQPWGIDGVSVDGAWLSGLKYDSQNTCGGIGAITVTLAPGTHTIEAYDQILSIDPATVTVTEGGCTVHQITGTSTCLSPNFISNGVCYAPTAPLTCNSPQVLQNGVCVTPGTSAGTGTSTGTGTGGSGTDGGMAGTFIGTGAGTNAANCLSFGYLTSPYLGHDSQTITNNCSFPVYVMRCHSPTTLPGTSGTVCGNGGKFYQQFHWIEPGGVYDNFYSLPPETTIWYGACSGGSLPTGTQVSLTGDYVCN